METTRVINFSEIKESFLCHHHQSFIHSSFTKIKRAGRYRWVGARQQNALVSPLDLLSPPLLIKIAFHLNSSRLRLEWRFKNWISLKLIRELHYKLMGPPWKKGLSSRFSPKIYQTSNLYSNFFTLCRQKSQILENSAHLLIVNCKCAKFQGNLRTVSSSSSSFTRSEQ